uniref:60S acidic ribosomal protein P2 n=1 Tax=Compsopogon caeruleus TaxID=31354 RepID=A0A7S1XG57_9RHOD|mmetsp:Transcript_599/g.1199  ORF Transcript_599/g.1199 Transcript_599/m.1199 type:complete len:115 (+) Transcript_599:26-370(+)
MKYLSAYMLAVMGGNESPTEDVIRGILSSVGAEIDDTILAKVMSELEGKDLMDVMAAGREKLASVPVGGAVAVGGGAGATGAVDAGGDAPAAAEEEKKEEEEEEDEDMGFSLFD